MYVRACRIRLIFQAKSVGKPSKETFGNVDRPTNSHNFS